MCTGDRRREARATLGVSVHSRAAMARVANLPEDALKQLWSLGARSLELTLPDRPEDEDFFRFAGELLEQGFEISLHTPYPNALDLQDFVDGQDPVGEYYRTWLKGVRRLPFPPHRPVLVVHGVNAPGVGPHVEPRARATSVAFLRWLGAELTRQQVPLQLAFEVRPGRVGWTKVGSTCSEVLAVVREAAGADAGICWDVGHTLMNVARGDDSWPPPRAFIERTIHTHLHVATAERDHLPLTSPAPLLREALGLLARVSYRGSLTLECLFTSWDEVASSLEMASRLWQEVSGRG